MDRENRTLLVVDRSATHLFYMGTVLRRLEYTVRSAKSAEDALKSMAEALPALVITDTALPAMNGIDLLKRMKRDQQLKAVPVIIHSSDDGPGVKERCMAAGCTAYFKKPADIETLYKAIQAALESAPRQTIRIETSLRVEVGDGTAPGGDVRQEYATALSEGGLYIKSLIPEPVNMVIPLKLFMGDRVIKATAVVLYSSTKIGGRHKEPGMGMKFVTISTEDRAFVRDYIKEQISKGLSL
jgi:CheY-like chemotaxis protein